ncbi:S-adenosyl-L-methionine-dependent methyltransferase [Aspergillus alliaceus]|uniref:S-adenosyl-L-methionine-dependent methyltransferase n=1 Tax=Petromyces alliaceus TaxID=209559 RepID=A0A5N7CJL8_PETAA|nr:S-adenosyl-L-methionine-dependent methyltransferase [Aspergillus alliaceus]
MPLSAAYDDSEIFRLYQEFPRNKIGLEAVSEWPLMKDMAQGVEGQNVLDLGSGFGWFCKWADENGARRVHGIDVSVNMLAKADEINSGGCITYEQADLNTLVLPANSFDLVHSSLAFHHVENLDRLIGQIQGSLKPGGRLVFSVNHPIRSAAHKASWQQTKDGEHFWPVSTYGQEGPRVLKWIADGIPSYHRTIQAYVSAVLKNGFELTDLAEYMKPPGSVPSFHYDNGKEIHRPIWLIISAKKK